MAPPTPKSCAVCGREITWRKKWERSWPEIKYCSDSCRRRAKSATASGEDRALEAPRSWRCWRNAARVKPSARQKPLAVLRRILRTAQAGSR